jgi:hypothetical protein
MIGVEESDQNASIREVFDRHMAMIVEACRNADADPVAIILYGGYGRDEGSWFQDEDGAWHPYNDYDVRIIGDRPVPPSRMKAIEAKLLEEIDIRWIDISHRLPKALKGLKPSILNYDLKYASKILYGDGRVLDLIPEIRAESLPMREAQVLYFTRLFTLLGSLDEDGFDHPLKGEASRFFRNQMAKAILAVVDVLLLERGAYDASYRTRVERVAELHRGDEELVSLSLWALEEKLRPQAPTMEPLEVLDLYRAVVRQFLPHMYRALSLRFGRPIRGPRGVEFALRWRPVSLLKRIYGLIRFRSMLTENRLRVQLAQSYIAAAYEEGEGRERHLRRGASLLRAIDAEVPAEMDWNEARVTAARLRLALP